MTLDNESKQSADEVTLCVITDLHIGHPCNGFQIGRLTNLPDHPKVAAALNDLLKEKHVGTLVCCGDLIHDPADTNAIANLETFLGDCTKGTAANVCAVLGNHDLWLTANGARTCDPWISWNALTLRLQPNGQDLHIPRAGPTHLRLGRALCDVFLLNNAWATDSSGAWKAGTEPFGTLSEEDLRWLDGKLAGSDATWSIVVSHFPLHYLVNDMTVDQEWITLLSRERQRLHNILERYPRAVIHFAGHTHESRVTHGQGAIEITTPAFNEEPHACRLLRVREDALTVETYTLENSAFKEVASLRANPHSITFQLGQQHDVDLAVGPANYQTPRSVTARGTATPGTRPTSFVDRLTDGDLRRLVREGFEMDMTRLRNRARAARNRNAWEGYVGHSLQQMNESRKAFVEDINRYVLLYSVMLGAIFILANQALNQPDRWLAVIEMFMAVGLTLYTLRILGLLRQKARASYSYYVASTFHAFVVHAAFCDSEPHTWMKHARNYLESVRKKNLVNVRTLNEQSRTWIRFATDTLAIATKRIFVAQRLAIDEDQWNADSIRRNWQRIAEERWTETSSHKNASNLFQSFDRAAAFSSWMLAGLCLIGITMCGLKASGVWDWRTTSEEARSILPAAETAPHN